MERRVKLFKGFKHVSFEESLKYLRLLNLKEENTKGEHKEVLKIMTSVEKGDFLSPLCIQGHLIEQTSRFKIRKGSILPFPFTSALFCLYVISALTSCSRKVHDPPDTNDHCFVSIFQKVIWALNWPNAQANLVMLDN